MPILFSNVRIVPSVDFGTGGLPFAYQPPHPSFALVGLILRTGDWIDQVTPIFAELLEDGATGPEILGPPFGGSGGTTHELRVAPGHVVTGIQTRSGNFVDAVRLQQTRWDGSFAGGETSWTVWAGAAIMGGVERQERLAEPHGGAIAVGLAGRSGRYVDNLTLITAELVRVPGTMVARGRTGRSSAAL